MRRPLRRADLAPDPFQQFARWWAEHLATDPPEPHAVTLATATPDGAPSARMVLLRGADERGFTFFTNYEGRKGRELDANPRAALVFYWPRLDRQVRVEGRVERASAAESDAYFASRSRSSQIGAWASDQSAPIAKRAALEARVAECEQRFAGRDVPRPPHWGGFRVVPARVEFWQEGEGRLHDRFVFDRDGGAWRVARLSP